MKKIFAAFLCILFGFFQTNAQNYRVETSNPQELTMHVTVGTITANDITTEIGTFSRITADGYSSTNEVGKPELPMMVKMIEIPVCDNALVTATPGRVKTYPASVFGINHPIFPAQPAHFKSHNGPFLTEKDDAAYNTNEFYGNELATIQLHGKMRCYNLATLYISPVQYNPVTNEIKIFEDIDITVTYVNPDAQATRQMKQLHNNNMFSDIGNIVINPWQFNTKAEVFTKPLKYLIVAHSSFRGQLDAFVAWKKRLGFIVEIAYTDDANVGTTTTTIAAYIKSHYTNATENNPAPTFVLLVGDVAQIPAFSGTTDSHSTDLYYCTWDSGNIPDCYYGRFPAQNTTQLTNILNKAMQYEQMTMPDPSYLDKAVLIAGTDANCGPTYGNGTINYITNNYINTDYGYSTVYAHLYNCSSQAATIRAEIGAGVGWANYTAHGGEDQWVDPNFSISHISAMENENKYGIMIGNCCLSNKFDENECFGEALVRKYANKGASAYIGGSNNTIWNEDYYWAIGYRSSITSSPTYNASNLGCYDRLFHTHNESFSNQYITLGSMITAGNMAVESTSSSYKLYYWEIYHLMGDPATMPWLTQPETPTVSIDGTAATSPYSIAAGTTSIVVNTVPYAYVALTHNNEVVTAATTNANGEITLSFPDLIAGEPYELAVSAQNYKHTFVAFNVLAAEGARVQISDVAITNNALASANANITLDVTLINRFPETATNVVVSATTSSPYITLTDDQENIGNFDGNNHTQTYNASIGLTVAAGILNGTIVPIDFTVSYTSRNETETTTYTYLLTLAAPELKYISHQMTITNGNSDHVVDPGESVTLTITDQNIGRVDASDVISELSTHYTLAPVTNGSVSIGNVAADATCQSTFTINFSTEIALGTRIRCFRHLYSESHPEISLYDTLYIQVGSPTITETWESNSFSTNGWDNRAEYGWVIVNSGAHSGTYCAKSNNAGYNNTDAILNLTFTSSIDGEISFYKKVSSEQDYDFFQFYLDNDLKEEKSCGSSGWWSSCTPAWEQSAYPVTAGTHTMTFVFSKDQSEADGSDCAWIDDIVFPASGPLAPEDDFSTGIHEPLATSVSVYPNPTTDNVTIVVANGQATQVLVYDIYGNRIIQQNIGNNTTTLNLQHLSSGMYLLQVSDGKQLLGTKKIIKK